MGRQWERQLLLPFSFYIDAKVLLFFELAKFNLECEPHGRLWDNYSVIVRLSFAHCSLILRSSFAYPSLIVRLLFAYRLLFLYCSLYIVLFVFFNFYIF